MPIDEGDQERWDELPGVSECEASNQDSPDFIECIKVAGPSYTYASCVGSIMVGHESEKVSIVMIWQRQLLPLRLSSTSQSCCHAGAQLSNLAIILDSCKICRAPAYVLSRLLEGTAVLSAN